MFSTVAPDGAAERRLRQPVRPEVLGSLDPDRTLSGYAVRLHGELMAGRWGDHVIELGACWAVVMALTGYYLFVRGWRARRRARASRVPARGCGTGTGSSVPSSGSGLLTAPGVRPAVDRPLGREGAGARHRPRVRRCGAPTRAPYRDPTSTPRRVAAAQPRHDVPWGVGESEVPRSEPGDGGNVANVDTAVAGRRRRGPAAPDDGRAAGRRGRRLLRDRLRLRRAVRRAHRPRRPVRRRDGVDVRLRRLPGAGQGGLAGHRPARGPQPRAVVVLGLGADVRGGDLHVRHRPADVVAAAAAPGPASIGRAPRPDAAARDARCWSWASSRSACSCRCSGSSLLLVLLLDQLVLRRVPRLGAFFDVS